MITIKRGGKALFQAREAKSLFSRAFGIMFSKDFSPLLFDMHSQAKHSFHSFFCPRFEAVFLDASKKVVGISKIISPQFFSCKREFSYVLELPVDWRSKHGIKEGQFMSW